MTRATVCYGTAPVGMAVLEWTNPTDRWLHLKPPGLGPLVIRPRGCVQVPLLAQRPT